MYPPAPSDVNYLAQPASLFRSRILMSQIIRDSAQKARVTGLVGEDAQCIADFLSVVRSDMLVSMFD